MRNDFAFGMIKTGRMELHEFHVGNRRAGAKRHRHAVAGGDVGIGRVEINLAATARRQQRHRRGEGPDAARLFVKNVRAEAAVFADVAELLAGDQINGDMVFENLDVRLAAKPR